MNKTKIILDGHYYPVQNPQTLLTEDIIYGKELVIHGLGIFKILYKVSVLNSINDCDNECVINTERIV